MLKISSNLRPISVKVEDLSFKYKFDEVVKDTQYLLTIDYSFSFFNKKFKGYGDSYYVFLHKKFTKVPNLIFTSNIKEILESGETNVLFDLSNINTRTGIQMNEQLLTLEFEAKEKESLREIYKNLKNISSLEIEITPKQYNKHNNTYTYTNYEFFSLRFV